MKTTSANSETDIRGIVLGGCVALLALLLSLAASDQAAQQEVLQKNSATATDRSQRVPATSLPTTAGNTLARFEQRSAAR